MAAANALNASNVIEERGPSGCGSYLELDSRVVCTRYAQGLTQYFRDAVAERRNLHTNVGINPQVEDICGR